jgi:hypothetical protein
MNKVLPNLRLIPRWIVIIGVMIGLFFSSGEGIQLLPFSAAHSEIAKENSAKIELGTAKFYSYSVRNTGLYSFVGKNKVQKNSKDFDGFVSNNYENYLSSFKGFAEVITQNYFQAVFLNASSVTAIPSDRAPPLV